MTLFQCTSPGSSGLLVRIQQAAEMMNVGRSTVYVLIAQQELEVVHIGRSARIPTQSILDLIQRKRETNGEQESKGGSE